MFCDELKIEVQAGKGGDGCSSFRREKFISKGGPDGGDGGNGGNVIIKVNTNLNTLGHIAHKKVFRADNGVNGKRKNMHGANANSLIIEVPKGTLILNKEKTELISDLEEDGAEFVIAKGGKGGLGNARFSTSTNQAPRFAETGEPGKKHELVLELKLVADIGLIGLPSAGKSTLISVISNAKPKIAAYHFTTLSPNLGIVNMDRFGGNRMDTFIVADIPGLIEGASKGKGLGHQFLKHITRTKLLVHLVDATNPDVPAAIKVINKELNEFDKKLGKRDQILVVNKMDLLDEESLDKLKKELPDAIFISAVAQKGLKELMFEALKELSKIKEEVPEEEAESIPVLKPHLEEVKFRLEEIIEKNENKIFKIIGKRIEQMAVMTDTNSREGIERMYYYFDKTGIQKLVEKNGAKLGDSYEINKKIIPYRK